MELFNVYPLQPINIVKALGSYVWDDADTKYLDMYGGHAVISIGHTNTHWVNSIQTQLNKIAFYSNSVQLPIQNELAKKLGAVSGKSDYQLFLCNSGAEANENALKLASFYNGRRKIVSFTKAFHGRTSLAVSATDNKSIIAPVNETDNIIFLPFNDTSALNDYFEQFGNEVCAVIIEGIQGVGGINIADDSFLQQIRQHCNTYNAIYIADSVQCGYARTGKFFAHDYAGVEADIYTMAKGMGNGFPIGGIIVSPKIKAKHFQLGTTFGGNPLACSAALAVLEVIEKEYLVQNSLNMGNYLMQELQKIPGLKNVRGRGLMIGFEFAQELETLKTVLLHEFKVFTGEAKPNIIRLLPSLAINKKEIDDFLHKINAAINFIENKQHEQ
jgi:acetylornithine/N-succinyldiaminopimelate aminotransferase